MLRFIYPRSDIYIHAQIYISALRYIYPRPDFQIYISVLRYIYPRSDIYIHAQIYISTLRFIYPCPDLYFYANQARAGELPPSSKHARAGELPALIQTQGTGLVHVTGQHPSAVLLSACQLGLFRPNLSILYRVHGHVKTLHASYILPPIIQTGWVHGATQPPLSNPPPHKSAARACMCPTCHAGLPGNHACTSLRCADGPHACSHMHPTTPNPSRYTERIECMHG